MGNNKVYLEIDSLETLIAFIQDVKGIGLLKDVSMAQVRHKFSKMTYPLRVPVNLNSVISMADNKVVNVAFGETIEKMVTDFIVC